MTAPLVALAEMRPSPALTDTASQRAYHHQQKPTGSYKSEMRRRSNMSKEHARASADRIRKMRQQ
jgi:hypothetical protein